MFILLKTGAMLNLYWLQDCFQGKHEKNIVIFYMINGSKVIETYDTETDAYNRVNEVHQAMEKAGGGSAATVNSINGKSGDITITADDIALADGTSIEKVVEDTSTWNEY